MKLKIYYNEGSYEDEISGYGWYLKLVYKTVDDIHKPTSNTDTIDITGADCYTKIGNIYENGELLEVQK
jgi:hypothetical protein